MLIFPSAWIPQTASFGIPATSRTTNKNALGETEQWGHRQSSKIFQSFSSDFPGGESLGNEGGNRIDINNPSIEIQPIPELNGLEVATLCMNALQHQMPKKSLEICFNFSSDRCRAAVGGTLEEFFRYAQNPVFGKLVHCCGWSIASVGPIIPGSNVRGDMQTILIEISKGLSVQDALDVAIDNHNSQVKHGAPKRRPIEERIAEMDAKMRGEPLPEPSEAEGARTQPIRFLWTMQKERRPPRQNCWLVHEVLFVNNAHEQTV